MKTVKIYAIVCISRQAHDFDTIREEEVLDQMYVTLELANIQKDILDIKSKGREHYEIKEFELFG